MDSPARQRLAQVSPDGYIAQSGVASFRRRLVDPASAEEFHAWAENPLTVLLRSALQDLVVNGPLGMANPPTDVAVQYGFTSGLSLALQLITDPSIVFPEVFRGRAASAKPMPDQTFDTDPEDALGT